MSVVTILGAIVVLLLQQQSYLVCHSFSFTVNIVPKEGAKMNKNRVFSKMWFLVLLVAFVAGCGGNGGDSSDSTKPTVNSTNPAKSATAVAVNSAVTVTFSEAMLPSTIGAATFTLKQGTTAVTGVVTFNGVTAVFTPAGNLAVSTEYTATITTGAKDLAGNAVASDYVWTFTTGTAIDITAPAVTGTINASGATNVAINSKIGATFGEGMDPLTITNANFTLKDSASGAAVPGTVSYSGVNALFTPASNLATSTGYTATIKGGAGGVKDLAGNTLAADFVWSFTTAAAADTTLPVVTSTNPGNLATNVALNSTVKSTFSEAIDPLTINTASFRLAGPGAASVTGTVGYNALAKTATFTPTAPLAASTAYTATITTGIKDLAGNALATQKEWSFTTVAAIVHGPSPVLLGTAGNYVILAETGVSTVPGSAVTGDIGLSPAATTYLTGFSLTMVGTTAAISPQVTGSLYAADMTAPTSTYLTTAVTDMGTAYTDAAGRPTPDFLDLGVGEIGGQTLSPGLYNWTTGVTVSSDVFISGGPNAVWIFQIPGNLSISPAKKVFLSGGAQAKNIFWQVAGTVNIGTTAHFEGIILSQTSITLETGASMNGRALAQSAVILDASTVTKPN